MTLFDVTHRGRIPTGEESFFHTEIRGESCEIRREGIELGREAINLLHGARRVIRGRGKSDRKERRQFQYKRTKLSKLREPRGDSVKERRREKKNFLWVREEKKGKWWGDSARHPQLGHYA